jgi:hypothetical protein
MCALSGRQDKGLYPAIVVAGNDLYGVLHVAGRS